MSRTLDLVYRHRQLAAKCEPGGAGLSFDEIDTLCGIEARFAGGPTIPAGSYLPGVLRARAASDSIRILDFGPGGAVLGGAPYLDEGETVDLVVDDREHAQSYRFKARVEWLCDDEGDDFSLGLRFVGPPVLLRYGGRAATLARAA
jgi:hypothetical protein